MARRNRASTLLVYINARRMGWLHRQSDGAISFQYGTDYLNWDNAIPASLSLPLRERSYRGGIVSAFFENLLPETQPVRRRIAEQVGAEGTDAFSLLYEIGRDCIGALQLVPEDADYPFTQIIRGDEVSNSEIAQILTTLSQTPLGLGHNDDEDFRISVAGVQEKTALLRHEGQWLRPHGQTPTSHILKPPIGRLANGMDLSDSVENEFYCLNLLRAFGLPAADVEIGYFGEQKALIVERFDRLRTAPQKILRLPQEDCCQALGVAATQKYEREGGPGIVDIMKLINAADEPLQDQRTFFVAQLLFWLIGATDGHAKNFSLFLKPHNSFSLTPLYDVVSVQPNLDREQLPKKGFKLSMSIGEGSNYRIDYLRRDHFEYTGLASGLSKRQIRAIIEEVLEQFPTALDQVEAQLPDEFPAYIHNSISAAGIRRLQRLARG